MTTTRVVQIELVGGPRDGQILRLDHFPSEYRVPIPVEPNFDPKPGPLVSHWPVGIYAKRGDGYFLERWLNEFDDMQTAYCKYDWQGIRT